MVKEGLRLRLLLPLLPMGITAHHMEPGELVELGGIVEKKGFSKYRVYPGSPGSPGWVIIEYGGDI